MKMHVDSINWADHKRSLQATSPRDNAVSILFVIEEYAEYLLVADLLSSISHTQYSLTWCNQFDEALEKFFSDQFDIVLLDYHWCGFNTHELLIEAQAKGCRLPIIVMTDEMEFDLDREIIQTGVSDYLIKGHIDAQLLERSLRYAIERKIAELKLAKLAHYDILTNVPNRILFRDRLEHALRFADRDQNSFTLMYLDLDGFKQVNDSFGHDVGDKLIQACAQRLCHCMRKSDSVARIGGDEFTLLIERTESTTHVNIAHIAEKIIDEVSRPYQIGIRQVTIGCSIGIAVYPSGGRDADTLQKHADMAMYQAKQQPKSAYRFFTDAMNLEVSQQLLLESDLRRALNNDEFTLYYQPRYDATTREMTALEALLRWNHPRKGVVEPDEFLSVVEDTGMIVSLGYWVIRRACEDFKILQQRACAPGLLTINLSRKQILDDKLPVYLEKILRETGVNGTQLEIEISEVLLLHHTDRVNNCITALSRLGCTFALGDFGAGYSSFVLLQNLPLKTVKLDRQLIDISESVTMRQSLIKGMIKLMEYLDKQVVAVGIEGFEQMEWLHQAGCHQVQGNLFSNPVSFKSLSRLLDHMSLISNEPQIC